MTSISDAISVHDSVRRIGKNICGIRVSPKQVNILLRICFSSIIFLMSVLFQSDHILYYFICWILFTLFQVFPPDRRVRRIPFLLQFLGFALFQYILALFLFTPTVFNQHSTTESTNNSLSQKTRFLSPTTVSVVLPCANENEFVFRTVKSIWEATPAKHLQEIIVVDDGSTPKLETLFSKENFSTFKLKIVRHEHFTGLINAKLKGGNAATGDIVIFLDCHVKPIGDWTKEIIENIDQNYKRVVVPTITSLNVDTWEEEPRGSGQGMAKCYLTWDADFKWFNDDTPYVPVMSGGLLAMSNKWWRETGGYDTAMVGWGGENIDQSLRIWLCGGEIVHAPNSFVAHMWRLGNKPKTLAKYTTPANAVVTNRYRAVLAWYGDWIQKTWEFSIFSGFKNLGYDPYKIGTPHLNISNILEYKDKLKCHDFSWFIKRFEGIYEWAGLLPTNVFQIHEETTNMCLQRQSMGKVVMAECSDSNKLQLWHGANRDGTKCCSGIRGWNSDQCLAGHLGGQLSTFVCNTYGHAHDQHIKITDDGKLQLSHNGCVGGHKFHGPKLEIADCPESGHENGFNFTFVPNDSNGVNGYNIIEQTSGFCVSPGERSAGGGYFELQPCDSSSMYQRYFIDDVTVNNAVVSRIQTMDHMCFDFAGGNGIIPYSCYDLKIENGNQLWVRKNGLIRNDNKCIYTKTSKDISFNKVGLSGCVTSKNHVKYSQDFKRVDVGDYFFIQSRDGRYCAAADATERIVMMSCDKEKNNMLWMWQHGKNLKNIAYDMCLDSNDGNTPILYSCYPAGNTNTNQEYFFNGSGFIKNSGVEKCLDFNVSPGSDAPIVACTEVAKFRWKTTNSFVPIERQLYLGH